MPRLKITRSSGTRHEEDFGFSYAQAITVLAAAAMCEFLATGIRAGSQLPLRIPVSPVHARSGVFMPIICRMLADRMIRKTVTTTREAGTPRLAVTKAPQE